MQLAKRADLPAHNSNPPIFLLTEYQPGSKGPAATRTATACLRPHPGLAVWHLLSRRRKQKMSGKEGCFLHPGTTHSEFALFFYLGCGCGIKAEGLMLTVPGEGGRRSWGPPWHHGVTVPAPAAYWGLPVTRADPVAPTLQRASESPGGLINTQGSGTFPQTDPEGLK